MIFGGGAHLNVDQVGQTKDGAFTVFCFSFLVDKIAYSHEFFGALQKIFEKGGTIHSMLFPLGSHLHC